jgi:hypothetical protein
MNRPLSRSFTESLLAFVKRSHEVSYFWSFVAFIENNEMGKIVYMLSRDVSSAIFEVFTAVKIHVESSLKKEAAWSFETLLSCNNAAQRHNPELYLKMFPYYFTIFCYQLIKQLHNFNSSVVKVIKFYLSEIRFRFPFSAAEFNVI